ncbi:AAA family ATPase [Lacisediminihabitans sp. H27-G8]|uniref:helix-turn-helix transcriptional regulator n=1 Tax=Lacisediminihabitans sp. H27-G8 TaxID=3111909 RepID=UPI0038FC7B4F
MLERAEVPAQQLRGREAELGIVAALFESVAPSGQLVVLEGDPGIGKTALLSAAEQYAQAEGFSTSRVVAIETETALPFAGLEQALRQYLICLPQLTEGRQAALRSALGIAAAATPQPFLVGLAALDLLVAASEQKPIALFLDDVQWLDQLSHDAFTFVARRASAERITLVCSARTGTRGALIESMERRIEVRPVDEAAAALILSDHTSGMSERVISTVLHQAAGNPLALIELPASFPGDRQSEPDREHTLPLTGRLEQSFAGRLSTLPRESRAVAIIAAIHQGSGLDVILTAAASYLGQPVTRGALDSLTSRGLVKVQSGELWFRHSLARSAVIQASSPGQRERAHRSLAETLREDPLHRAWHQANSISGIDDDIADELEFAVALSVSRGAIGRATWYLERAADMTSDPARRAHRLLLASLQACDMGRPDIVERLVQRTAFLPLSSTDTARVELVRETYASDVPGDATRIRQLCVLAAGVASEDLDLALDLLFSAATRCWWGRTGPTERGLVVDCALALHARARSDARFVGALALSEPVLETTRVNGLLEQFAPASVQDAEQLRVLGLAAFAVGDSPLAGDYLDRAEARLRSEGRVGLLLQVLGIQMAVHYYTGEWWQSTAAMHESTALSSETGQPIWDTALMLGRAQQAALCGELEQALRLASEVEISAQRRRMSNVLSGVQLARGSAWCNAGNYSEAFVDLLQLFDTNSSSHHLRKSYTPLLFLADAAVHCARIEDARKIVAQYEELAATTPSADLHAHLAYARAVLAPGEAEQLFRDALGSGVTRFPFVRAMTEQAYGSWLRRRRRIVESRRYTRSALGTFELIGAAGWAKRARAELAASGEAPTSRSDVTDADLQLTPQQAQIARLAAQGLSNREIGERLFLSPRTVGSHLYRIYPKVGVSSRIHLAGRIDPH